MSTDTLRVEGRLYLRLEVVAQVYRVEPVWLESVYARGLLGPGIPSGQSVAIAALQLDRVATIVRLSHVLELDLDAIELQLTDRGEGMF